MSAGAATVLTEPGGNGRPPPARAVEKRRLKAFVAGSNDHDVGVPATSWG
jgi:hypothetical protein